MFKSQYFKKICIACGVHVGALLVDEAAGLVITNMGGGDFG
jgi:hypothetical protein